MFACGGKRTLWRCVEGQSQHSHSTVTAQSQLSHSSVTAQSQLGQRHVAVFNHSRKRGRRLQKRHVVGVGGRSGGCGLQCPRIRCAYTAPTTCPHQGVRPLRTRHCERGLCFGGMLVCCGMLWYVVVCCVVWCVVLCCVVLCCVVLCCVVLCVVALRCGVVL